MARRILRVLAHEAVREGKRGVKKKTNHKALSVCMVECCLALQIWVWDGRMDTGGGVCACVRVCGGLHP